MASVKPKPVAAGNSTRPQISTETVVKSGSSGSLQDLRANKLVESWLDWQCKMIAGVYRAVIGRVDSTDQLIGVAAYPHSEKKSLLDPGSALMKTLNLVQVNNQPLVIRQNEVLSRDGLDVCDCLALRLKAGDDQYFVCLHLKSRSKAQLLSVQQLLTWGGVWLSALTTHYLESLATETTAAYTSDNLLQRVVAAKSLYESSCELVNTLKGQFNCDRVYLGLRESLSVRVVAISQQANFDRRQHAIREREAAIEECMDQGCVLSSDDARSNYVLAIHKKLGNTHSGLSVCTVPIVFEGECIGAVLLEKKVPDSFSDGDQQACLQLLEGLAPAVNLQMKSQLGALSSAMRGVRQFFITLIRPETYRQRWRSLSVFAIAAAIMLMPVTHHVSATASVEGADKHLLVALQTGFIKSAQFRAGDLVSAGDVVASFDNQDLLIDRDKWQGELNSIETAFSQVLGTRNRAEIGLLKSRKQQVSAELALVEKRLARTQVVAPFDGVLVSGDLNQSLGAPVESGQTLFEIASLADFRIILSVNERDVAAVEPGQDIRLRLSALPGRTYQAHVESLLPVSISEDGRSFFRVVASVDEVDGQLKPGMRGVAKIDTQRDSLIWVWIHPLVERISLWLWSLA